MESEGVKQAIIRQAREANSQSNARLLIEGINNSCFDKCVPKPGSSLSNSENACVVQCMEKYIAAWNEVNRTYIRRIQQEVGNQQIGNH
ncbi:Tim10/DDP family zinc finger-domain-containing protein [Cladorrhinum samala]|uniref:Mitochondrial import inner membrane translocase subunit n=1 Tax=Cladorrhinum samala TaxID=585594 RepID=A0AAV9HJU1_9PEZI|nr:Tim10/DDP family zinc finger-domain-containing protein [Cladorrhinum samala]